MQNKTPPRGLDPIERTLFLFGVFAFGFLMLALAQPLPAEAYLPLVAGWIIAGVTFAWWFDRFLASRNR